MERLMLYGKCITLMDRLTNEEPLTEQLITRTVDKTGKCITSKFNRCNAEIKFGTDEAGNLVRILHSYKWNGKKYMNWYCQVCESGQECKNVLYQSTDRNKSGALFEPEAGRGDCERGHTGIRAKYDCQFK